MLKISSIHKNKSNDLHNSQAQLNLVENLQGGRSQEAQMLPGVISGDIKLRLNGIIDFPNIGLFGCQMLNSQCKTDLINHDLSLVSGIYENGGKSGIENYIYMNPERAKIEADKVGLQLIPNDMRYDKYCKLMTILGRNGKEQQDALAVLFGPSYSGDFCPSDIGKGKARAGVHYHQCLGFSELLEKGGAICLSISKHSINGNWRLKMSKIGNRICVPYLAFEKIVT